MRGVEERTSKRSPVVRRWERERTGERLVEYYRDRLGRRGDEPRYKIGSARHVRLTPGRGRKKASALHRDLAGRNPRGTPVETPTIWRRTRSQAGPPPCDGRRLFSRRKESDRPSGFNCPLLTIERKRTLSSSRLSPTLCERRGPWLWFAFSAFRHRTVTAPLKMTLERKGVNITDRLSTGRCRTFQSPSGEGEQRGVR